jgi:hypothetical protein
MRKAALIYLWRGGFQTSVCMPLAPAKAQTALRFLREIVVSLHALLNMYDEQRITIMNVMTWPLVVCGNECGTDPHLQEQIKHLLRGVMLRFGIHHIEHILTLLDELWRRVCRASQGSRGNPGSASPLESGFCEPSRATAMTTSLEAVSQEMGFCLPLY